MNKNTEKINKNHLKYFKEIHGDKYTYGEFRIIFASNRKQKQINIICNTCENNWWMLVANHKKGTGCKICSINNSQDSLRDIEKKVKLKHNIDFEFLSLYKEASRKRVLLKCSTHGEFSIDKESLIATGCVCPTCYTESLKTGYRYNRKSYEEMKEEVEDKLQGVVLTSKDDYPNNYRTPIELKCNRCEYTWRATPDNIMQGTGCPDCARKGSKYLHKQNAIKNKEEWKKTSIKLYIIECWRGQEHFYKIGLTTRTIEKRFTNKFINKNMPYSFNVLLSEETDKYTGVMIESFLHNLHKEFSYTPNIKFGGYTECFSKLIPFSDLKLALNIYLKTIIS